MASKNNKERTDKKRAAKNPPVRETGPDQAKGDAPDPQQAELVTLSEVAAMLRMHPVQVRKLAQTGKIPGVKVDGEWRFNKDLVYQAYHRRARGR